MNHRSLSRAAALPLLASLALAGLPAIGNAQNLTVTQARLVDPASPAKVPLGRTLRFEIVHDGAPTCGNWRAIELPFRIGASPRYATFAAALNGNTLVFQYVIRAGDNGAVDIPTFNTRWRSPLCPTSGGPTNTLGTTAPVRPPAAVRPWLSVAYPSRMGSTQVLVDTILPTVIGIDVSSPLATPLSGLKPDVEYTVTFSEPVRIDPVATPVLSIENTAAPCMQCSAAAAPTDRFVFRLSPVPGWNKYPAITGLTGDVSDEAGNAIRLHQVQLPASPRTLFLDTRAPAAPAAPLVDAAKSALNQLTLTWNAPLDDPRNPPCGACRAPTVLTRLERFDGGSSWMPIGNWAAGNPSVDVLGLSRGTSHRFRVAATDDLDNVSYSAETAASTLDRIRQPEGLRALNATSSTTGIALEWKIDRADAVAYTLRRLAPGPVTTLLDRVAPSPGLAALMRYQDAPLTQRGEHRYELLAHDRQGGDSDPAITTAIHDDTPPVVTLGQSMLTTIPAGAFVLRDGDINTGATSGAGYTCIESRPGFQTSGFPSVSIDIGLPVKVAKATVASFTDGRSPPLSYAQTLDRGPDRLNGRLLEHSSDLQSWTLVDVISGLTGIGNAPSLRRDYVLPSSSRPLSRYWRVAWQCTTVHGAAYAGTGIGEFVLQTDEPAIEAQSNIPVTYSLPATDPESQVVSLTWTVIGKSFNSAPDPTRTTVPGDPLATRISASVAGIYRLRVVATNAVGLDSAPAELLLIVK
jgi:hypothetical protein